MNITECIPLAGRGLVARRGHLVALTDGMDAGPVPLLTALTAVADANGDGAASCWPERALPWSAGSVPRGPVPG